MTRMILLAMLALTLGGCATSQTHWVDAKGRDCIRTVKWVTAAYSTETDECTDTTGPLATQPYKVDAQITQKTQ